MVSHWSLSDSKSSQVFRTLLSILVDLNNVVVFYGFLSSFLFPSPPDPLSILCWLYRTHQLQLVSPLHWCFIVFFSSLARFRYLSLFRFLSAVVSWNGQVDYLAGSLFLLLTITRSGRLFKIWWSVCISRSQGSLCVSFSRVDSVLCIYHLFVWSNLNFLHNS